MPNWCVGTLKVRGKQTDVKRFVLEGLRPVNFMGEELEPLKPDGHWIHAKEDCWIKGTHRGFASVDVDFFDEEDGEQVIRTFEVRFAWSINSMELLAIAKEFNIDMRIYGFERGLQFNQEIEIINGKITKDNEITYDDYTWECLCPDLGG